MKGNIEIPFALGTPLWWTGYGSRDEWITCEECQGTKASIVMLANGETYSLDCAACSCGYDPPRGVVKHTFMEYKPTLFIPRRVDMSFGELRYGQEDPESSCWRPVEVSKLYESREECEAACGPLNEAQHKTEKERVLCNMKSKRRNMAFSVHYWRGQLARSRKDAEAAEERLHVCIEREKAVKVKRGEAK